MTIEIVLLALASTVRPTSLAAVYALLASRAPRRLMIVYVVAGLAFTVTFGVVVISAFNGIDIGSGTDRTKGIAEIVAGVLILAFAVGVLTGRIGGRQADDAPKAPSRWSTRFRREVTPATAAFLGPATHIPGLFYLVALNVIIAHEPDWPQGLVEVVIYNVVWFALPLLALAICIVKPQAARDTIAAVEGWTKDHIRQIVVVVSFVAGAGLIVRGALVI